MHQWGGEEECSTGYFGPSVDTGMNVYDYEEMSTTC